MTSWDAPPVDVKEAIKTARDIIEKNTHTHVWVDTQLGCSDGHVYPVSFRTLRRPRLFFWKWSEVAGKRRWGLLYRIFWRQKSVFCLCPECGKPTDRIRLLRKKFEAGEQAVVVFPWTMLGEDVAVI